MEEIPDIFNSKIKKLRIELPHYDFSHSSSGDSPHDFIGRERIREKLKKVMEDAPDEPGVYLIAGNRGVGKTSLVNWVIKKTSLPQKSKFDENFIYMLLLFFAVAGTQFLQQIFENTFLESFLISFLNCIFIWLIIFAFSFILLCYSNGYRRKYFKQTDKNQKDLKKCIEKIYNFITSAIKEMSYLINPYISYRKLQYILKIVLVVCYTQIISIILNTKINYFIPFLKTNENIQITPTKTFVFYLYFVFAFMIWRFIKSKLREYYRKYKKDELSEKYIFDIENERCIKWINLIFKCITTLILFSQFLNICYLKMFLFCLALLLFMILILVCIWCKNIEKGYKLKCIINIIFFDPILDPIKYYIKSHSRLYLRINFGHNLKEKDILRLISRTLSTKYNDYLHLFKRMLPCRIFFLGLLFIFVFLFSDILINEFKSYEPIKNSTMYKASSQIFVKRDTYYSEEDNKKRLKLFTSDSSEFNKAEYSLLLLDDIIFNISKRAVNIPEYLWEGKVDLNKTKLGWFIFPVNYLFWLSFFLMYLFFIILFRCNWITHFLVTHQIIKRRLKRLNSDITHRTELETSINVNSAKIGTKTKKTRNAADAREIEKELQDILSDIQRIPLIMCRPNIIIMFDELDKVEPGEAGSEKENLQTKASLFSIHATRERQTEILRILSNMKYFLSTAHAKFIFIAGREMFDIHLADVSERNNYIGSIFNVVIPVPSFLTDHHTGKKSILQESSIASLPEEFVCSRLIPHDYPVESYDLKNYRDYLERKIFIEDTQKIDNIIDSGIIEEKIKRIIPNKENVIIKQILTLLPEQNKKIKRNIINKISFVNEEEKINIIKKEITLSENNIINKIKINNEQNKEIIQIIQNIQNIISDVKDEKIKQIHHIEIKYHNNIKNITKRQRIYIINIIKIKILNISDEKIEEKIIQNENIKKIKEIQKYNNKINKNEKLQINKKIKSVKDKNIKQEIRRIISSKSEEKIEHEINKIIAFVKDENIEKYMKILIEQNKELEQKIINVIKNKEEKIQKTIAVLQQFIIYLAHVSKGAPKKMLQLFESFIDIRNDKDDEKNTLLIQRYYNSRHFLSFNYYKQYTLGIIAYLITPIFYRLSESNIKEHSDKLLVSSLRFVDFLFKFHKHSFSWKHLDMSPEMMEVNRAPELKSVAVELLNYLAQVHINKSNFSLSEYKFDGIIANEIFAMTKTDEVFSALFSFSLDEMLPLKKHYQDLLEKAEKEYRKKDKNNKIPVEFIDAISSLQGVLGDLHYYDDELEEAEAYYKNAVNALHKNEEDEKMQLGELYQYVRNMLRLGIIYEKRKQYDFAYLTYGELCKRIIRGRDITIKELSAGIVLRKEWDNNKDEGDEEDEVFVKASTVKKIKKEDKKYYDNIDIPRWTKGEIVDDSIASPQPLYFNNISPNTNDMLFKKITFEGLKMLYLPFIAKLQIIEQSHVGGITRNHLEQLDKEFRFLTKIIDHKEAKLLEAEFCSRVADILYYKNSDLKCKKNKNRRYDKDDDDKQCDNNDYEGNLPQNFSCTACYYYHKALSISLDKINNDKFENKEENTIINLLSASVEQLKDNYNIKFCTILARILSDWGNVFFSCDNKNHVDMCGCYIYDAIDCNTPRKCYYCARNICDMDACKTNNLGDILKKYINYVDSESKGNNREMLLNYIKNSNTNFKKMEIAFAMYTISSEAYRNANLYKRSAFQIYKMLCLFKDYKIYNKDYINNLSKKAIHYLWYANEDLNIFELNKRKKDFCKTTIKDEDKIPLQNLLVDSEITRIRVLVKELEFKSEINNMKLENYYDLRITSPYRINYSIMARIYRLRLKTKINYEAYKQLIKNSGINENKLKESNFILEKEDYEKLMNDKSDEITGNIFRKFLSINEDNINKIYIFENLIAESIYCLTDVSQLSKTMDETYLFPHSYLGSIHEHFSFWIKQFEEYEKYKKDINIYKEYKCKSQINELLEQYLGEEWREQLSGYRENQRALSHYYKCLEMHKEGKAYLNMLDIMCYVKDDFNDRSDHFNIAEERHLIINGKIEKKINYLKDIYKDSKIYKVDNYFNKTV
jgi:hypothetical protein